MMSIFGLFFLISVSSGTSVPALIWSPNRPLSDLPDVFAGHSVSSADFHARYLRPLSTGTTAALVVFVQDRLSLDDFTHYADVYNPDSSGGSFQNIKDFMDEQFSVQLPQVVSPLTALDTLKESYGERVQQLEAPYDVSGLSLSTEQGNLVVVHLPKTRPGAVKQSIANNDKLIGKVLVALGNKGVKYTAIYTAEASSQEESEPLKYSGRHLLETQTAEATVPSYNESLFVNGTCGLMYALALELSYKGPDETALAQLSEATLPADTPCGNFSEPMLWTISFGKVVNSTIKNVKLMLNFTVKPNTQNSDWYIANAEMTYTGKFNSNDTDGENSRMFKGQEIWAPRGMSYHCSKPSPIVQLDDSSNVTLRFTNLQIQPFGVRNGKFGLAWDCVGFFTAPIWMALFSILILLLILAYGLSMILNINVMDRFDDAKGKAIVINAQE